MRVIILSTLFLGVFLNVALAQTAGAPAGEYSLSVGEALATAYANNKELQIQAQQIDAARARILGTKAQFLPTVSANAGYTHNGYVLNLGSSEGAKKDKGILTGFANDNSAGISVGQILYNGGANTNSLEQARVNLKIQEQALRVRKQDLAFETRRLYYGLLLAQETENIAKHLVDLAQAHYEDVRKKYDAGVVSKFDVLQSQVQVSKLTPELIRARNAVELIGAELKKILGLSLADKVSLKDKLAYTFFAVNEKEFFDRAMLSNPELILQALGIDESRIGIELAKASGRPLVTAGAGLSFHSNDIGDMLDRRHENWSAGISMSVPVFDGFSTKAKVDEAKVRYAQTLLSKENLIDQIAVNVKRAVLDLAKAEALINSQKDSIAEAQEAWRISQVRYDNGEGTNLDVLDAQVSLSQVEKYYYDGIFDYVMAQAYLSKVLGSDVQVSTIDNQQ